MSPKILVVDDDRASVEVVVEALEREGYDLLAASGGREALQTLAAENVDVVITDEKMPDLSGIDLLKRIKDNSPYTQVIILTGYGTIDNAVEATKAGADGYLEKPIKINILRQTTKNAIEKRSLFLQNVNLRQQLDDKFGFANIIGTSKPMLELFRTIRLVAPTNATVLIRGESGVGKELIANAIYNHSRRKDKPYRIINCGALYRELLESELFGHERGAFTGATTRKLGLFEQASGGTLLLDEVGEMGPETQVKFLRVLEGHEFTRLGGEAPIKTDVRIIAATNTDLEAAVKSGKFRNDLYHRINRFPIRVPPLRERREDIPLLIDAFIKEFSKEHDRAVTGITPQAMDCLKNAAWDGNVRELRNAIETAIILATRETLQLDDFSSELQTGFTGSEVVLNTDVQLGIPLNPDTPDNEESGEGKSAFPTASEDEKVGTVGMTMEEIEKEAIGKTLAETGNNKKRAAEMLGIGLRTLYRKLESYGWLNKSDQEDEPRD
jgi:two-component system response regulator HydG